MKKWAEKYGINVEIVQINDLRIARLVRERGVSVVQAARMRSGYRSRAAYCLQVDGPIGSALRIGARPYAN